MVAVSGKAKWWSAGLWALAGASLPGAALARPAAPAVQQMSASLAERIRSAAQQPMAPDQTSDLPSLQALSDEAARSHALPPTERATVDRLLGESLVESGKPDLARAALDRARLALIAAGLDQSAEMARVLNGLAKVESVASNFAEGLRLTDQAEALLTRAFGSQSAELLHIQETAARLHYRGGALVQALALFRRAAAHPDPLPRDRPSSISSLVGVAQVLSGLGEENASIETYYRALDLANARLPAGHVGRGMIMSELSVHLGNVHRLVEAEAVGRQAVSFFHDHFGAASFDTAASLHNFGFLLAKGGKHAEAESLLSDAIGIFENPAVQMKQPAIKVDTYKLRAYARADREDQAGAEADFRAGLAVYPAGRTPPVVVANLQLGLAATLMKTGRLDEALAAADEAVNRYRQSMPPYSQWRVDGEMLRALLLVRLNRLDEAWSAAQPIARAMETRLLDPQISPRVRTGLVRIYRVSFARYAAIAHATGHQDEAFRAAQMASFSELSLSSQQLAARVAAADPAARDAARQIELLQASQFQLERERNFAGGRDAAAAARLDARIAEGRKQLAGQLEELRQILPLYETLARPQPVSIAAAQARLGRGRALLLPVMTDDTLLTLIVTRRGLQAGTATLDAHDASAAISELRAALAGGERTAFPLSAAWKLGQALFTPATNAALRQVKRIDVIGSGRIMALPFAALLTAPPAALGKGENLRSQPFAIRRFAFAVQPLVAGSEGPPAVQNMTFLGVGAPVLGALAPDATSQLRAARITNAALRDLPDLPQADTELRAMARQLTRSRPARGHAAPSGAILQAESVVLTGAGATEAALRAQPLARFGVLAFATHGLIGGDIDSLDEPALVLTPPGLDAAPSGNEFPSPSAPASENDGLLTASEAAAFRLDARWVILSACNTGAASENGAGGYSGLARGFMQAGARSLLVSLWPLRDDIAPRLTVDAVRRNARGIDRAEALRQAQLALIDDRSVPDGSEPALWAPFVLLGQ